MRIVSKFHDYYDVGQSLGQDQSIVYVRSTVDVVGSGDPRNTFDRHDVDDRNESLLLMIEGYTIGFCGSLFPVYHLRYRGGRQELNAWCYSLEDADRFIEQIKKESDRERFRECWEYGDPVIESGPRSQFSVQGKSSLLELFHKHNTPIFASQPSKTTINPLLRTYEFYRIKDPYTAFQEIQQFVSGTLRSPTNPIPKVSDEIMQEIKGFDHTYSFRKEPKI